MVCDWSSISHPLLEARDNRSWMIMASVTEMLRSMQNKTAELCPIGSKHPDRASSSIECQQTTFSPIDIPSFHLVRISIC